METAERIKGKTVARAELRETSYSGEEDGDGFTLETHFDIYFTDGSVMHVAAGGSDDEPYPWLNVDFEGPKKKATPRKTASKSPRKKV